MLGWASRVGDKPVVRLFLIEEKKCRLPSNGSHPSADSNASIKLRVGREIHGSTRALVTPQQLELRLSIGVCFLQQPNAVVRLRLSLFRSCSHFPNPVLRTQLSNSVFGCSLCLLAHHHAFGMSRPPDSIILKQHHHSF